MVHGPLDGGTASAKPAATVSTTSIVMRGLVSASRSAGATRLNHGTTTEIPV